LYSIYGSVGMGKLISNINLSGTLRLSECTDGFWLYDETRGMNLSMRAKTPQDAFVECITYYQHQLCTVEQVYNDLSARVDAFVNQFSEDQDD